MNRLDFQGLARTRIREAKILLDAKSYGGAYYLCGYAAECALKACIAKQTRASTFPDKNRSTQAHTHNLEQLIKVGRLEAALRTAIAEPAFLDNWNVVKDWSVEARYLVVIPEEDARDMYRACVARKHGVLSWVRTQW